MTMKQMGSTVQGGDEKQLVIFDLVGESYGVDIGSVREIIRMQEITAVPKTPEHVEGVIDLRGKVIPVIDMRKWFGFPLTERTKDTRIVVIDIGGSDIGVVVDAVSEVLRLNSDAIEPPSPVLSTADSDCLLGIGKLQNRLIIILDLKEALSAGELSAIALADRAGLMSPSRDEGSETVVWEEPVFADVAEAKKPKAKKSRAKQAAKV